MTVGVAKNADGIVKKGWLIPYFVILKTSYIWDSPVQFCTPSCQLLAVGTTAKIFTINTKIFIDAQLLSRQVADGATYPIVILISIYGISSHKNFCSRVVNTCLPIVLLDFQCFGLQEFSDCVVLC